MHHSHHYKHRTCSCTPNIGDGDDSDSDSNAVCPSPPPEASPTNVSLSAPCFVMQEWDGKEQIGNNQRRGEGVFEEGLNGQLCRFHQRRTLGYLVEHCCREKHLRRKKWVAFQFCHHLFMLRYFFTWYDYTKERIYLYQREKPLMRRIILKWKVYAEENVQRNRAVCILGRLTERLCVRALLGALKAWRHSSFTACQNFLVWRNFTRMRNEKHSNLICQFVQSQSTSLLLRIFIVWRNQIRILRVQSKHNLVLRRFVFQGWINSVEGSRQKRKKKARVVALLLQRGSLRLLARTMFAMRFYAEKKVKRREFIQHLFYNRGCHLLKLSMKQWILYHHLCVQRRILLSRIVKRCGLVRWRYSITLSVYRQRISLQIIFNRWKLLAEYSSERREKRHIAICYWASATCRMAINRWKAFHKEQKQMIRINNPYFIQRDSMPAKHHNDCGTKLDRILMNKNRTQDIFSMRSPIVSQSKVTAPLYFGDREQVPNYCSNLIRTSAGADAYDSTTSSLLTPYQQSVHTMTPVPFRIKNFSSEVQNNEMGKHSVQASPCFGSDFTSTECRLRPIEDLIVADNTNRTGIPNGARVPSWILNELSERKLASNGDFRCKQRHNIRDHVDIDAKPRDSYTSNPRFLDAECLYSALGNAMSIRGERNTKEDCKDDEGKE